MATHDMQTTSVCIVGVRVRIWVRFMVRVGCTVLSFLHIRTFEFSHFGILYRLHQQQPRWHICRRVIWCMVTNKSTSHRRTEYIWRDLSVYW